MSQVTHPHPQLVECRGTLETVLGLTRNHACAICNRLSDAQVNAVLNAASDKMKVQSAIEASKQEKPKPEAKEEKRPFNKSKK